MSHILQLLMNKILQNLPFLKSQISSSTSNSKTAVLNEKPKPGLPWYFKGKHFKYLKIIAI